MIEIRAIPQKQVMVARISDRLAQSDWNALETAVSQAACHFEAFDVRIELVRLDEEEAATLQRQLEFAGSYADRIQRLAIVADDDFLAPSFANSHLADRRVARYPSRTWIRRVRRHSRSMKRRRNRLIGRGTGYRAASSEYYVAHPATWKHRQERGLAMSTICEVAVIPAAERGTRMRPATHAVPKALLPIVDRPSVQR